MVAGLDRIGAGQVQLIPDRIPGQQLEMLDLEMLPPNEELSGPDPGSDLCLTVLNFGVREPIMVQRLEGRGDAVRYSVIEGRRRIKASRRAKHPTIPAMVVEADGSFLPATMGLMVHATRSDNPIVDLQRIEQLERAGASESDIGEATGLSRQTIRKRQRLQSLLPELRKGVEQGDIAISVAEQIAKLGPEPQQRLAALYVANGTVTAGDVRAERQVQGQGALEGLEFEDGPSEEELAAEARQTDERRQVLVQIHTLLTTRRKRTEDLIDARLDEADPDGLVVRVPGVGVYRLSLVLTQAAAPEPGEDPASDDGAADGATDEDGAQA